MKSREVSRNDMVSLYKTASCRMVKKALELSDDAKAALLGVLGGAGVGLASHMITPKDKDEDLRSRLISHVLTGAALGGLSGYGLKRLHSRVADAVKPESPGWYQRNVPELSYSRAATIGGIGTGAYAGAKGLDALKGSWGLGRLSSYAPDATRGIGILNGTSPERLAELGLDPANAAFVDRIVRAQNALADANVSLRDRILSRLPSWTPKALGGDAVRKAINEQGSKDLRLFERLRELGATPPHAATPISPLARNAHESKIIASKLMNPRKVVNALRRGAGKRKLWAALASLGLLGTGAVLRGINRD